MPEAHILKVISKSCLCVHTKVTLAAMTSMTLTVVNWLLLATSTGGARGMTPEARMGES